MEDPVKYGRSGNRSHTQRRRKPLKSGPAKSAGNVRRGGGVWGGGLCLPPQFRKFLKYESQEGYFGGTKL